MMMNRLPLLVLLLAALPASAAQVRPAKSSCPTMQSLSKHRQWVEHAGPVPQAVLDAHLSSEIDGAEAVLLPIDTVSWWVGASRRGRGEESALNNPGCFVLGSAAYYFYGLEYDPSVDFMQGIEDSA